MMVVLGVCIIHHDPSLLMSFLLPTGSIMVVSMVMGEA